MYECGLEEDNADTHTISFGTEFPDTNYAIMCTPGPDDDAVVCALKDSTNPKTTSGFGLFFNLNPQLFFNFGSDV